jgi:predicted component of type VI protein secretion system
MDFELVVVQGRSAKTTIKLVDGVTTVGRHDECQLRIKSSQVSRKHCELFEKKGLLLVKDLNSSNGTLVNGKRIQGQRVLEPGDELTIGPILLRVEKAGAAAGSAPPPPGAKAADTAVTAAMAAAAAADEGGSDEFALSIDDDTSPVEAAAVAAPAGRPAPKATPKAAAPNDDDFADFLIDMPGDEADEIAETETTQVVPASAIITPNPGSKAAAQAPAQPEPEPAKPQSNEPEAHDDAIADFLLDIKIDDEE